MSIDDMSLLGRLAALFERHDPMPAGIEEAADLAGQWIGRAWSWSPLALVAGGGAGRVRSEGGGPLLGFAGPAGRVDVEIGGDQDGVRLTGLFQGSDGAVWVRWPAGERQVEVDGFGRFTTGELPAGPLSIVVRRAGQPDAAGPWFVG
jgi:hypothetical protein